VDDTGEAYCSNTGAGPGGLETVVVEVQQAEEVFLVVDGVGADEAGVFALQTLTRPISCGDGIRDPGEACDDHNSDSDDGCSAQCVLESSEAEPNDTQGSAHPYGDLPEVGEISGASDVDVFSIEIEQDDSTLLAETLDLGDGTCANLVLDDRIEIVRSNGDVIAMDDDSGDGFCAVASAENLNAGTYFVRVTASGVATAFPYRLRLSRSP
jgi:cysteine-rich repeat protein